MDTGAWWACVCGRKGNVRSIRAFAQLNPAILIHAQHVHGGSAHGRSPGDFTIAFDEMIFPVIQARMIQAGDFFASRIDSGEVDPFAQIAVVTGEREIVRGVFSAMPPGNDMFDVKGERFLVLMYLAILATVFRASPDQLTQPVVHQAALALASALRALAWRMPMSVLACT